MKYEIRVEVTLSPVDTSRGLQQNALRMSEVQLVELETLSHAAGVLVKLHEFFEEIRKRGGQS